jgi:hypothetical protein
MLAPIGKLGVAHLRIVFLQLGMAALLAFLGARPGWAEETLPRSVAPAGALVYFISPADGAVVKSPVSVRFGLAGMGVAPAGIAREETGHHHLIVDSPLPDLSLPIPSDDHHQHFGGGQTETTLELGPGTHTLQLVMGDASHLPHEPPVISEQISITVTNLEVRLFQRDESSQYELIVEIPIGFRFDLEPFEDGIEERRARMLEDARNERWLEILAEEIQLTRRRRGAEQQRDLAIEVEESTEP